MTEVYISLYGEQAEAFLQKKEEIEEHRIGANVSNVETVMRLIERDEQRERAVEGGGLR